MPEHYFPGNSVITYVAEHIPHRAVFWCIQEEYTDDSQKIVSEFQKTVLDCKSSLMTKLENAKKESEKDSLRREIPSSIDQIANNYLGKMMDQVQLEPGNYELSITVKYVNAKKGIFSRKQKVTSSVTFSVDNGVRDILRSSLKQTLMKSSQNLLFDRNDLITYPEYQPINIKEAESF